MIDKYIHKILGFFSNWSEKLDKVFFPPKKKRKKKCKDCHCNCHCDDQIHAHWYDGIFTDKTRMFVQKTIWSCLAMANKIYS
jgi:hypothetical protein